jgi:hypothetical protein
MMPPEKILPDAENPPIVLGYNIFMTTENIGSIRAVRGSVVDVHFEENIPDIYTRLVTKSDPAAEIEVISHLSPSVTS